MEPSGNDVFNLNQSNFMPIIELKAINSTFVKSLDIFEDGLSDSKKIKDGINIDVSKLRNYFEIMIAVRERTTDTNLYSIIPYRRCKEQDFVVKNFNYQKFLCPDLTDKNKHLLRVQNYYNNLQRRVSFSVEIA